MNHRRKNFINGRLFGRIIILISLLIIFIVSVNTILSISSKTRILMKGLMEKNKLFILQLSTTVKSAFWSTNWYSVENIIKRSIESEEIIYCRVVKPDGEIFMADDRSLYGKKIADTHLLDTEEFKVLDAILPQTGEKMKLIINPIKIGSERWSIWLAVSLEPINRAKMSILYRNLVEGILIILLGGFIAFWLSRSITGPIAQLVEGTREISSGNLEYQINIATHDEVGQLADAFNQMTRELKRSRSEIEAYSKTLEEKVAERTKALEQSYALLDAKNKELESFVYTASHDLKAPLVSLEGFASMLLDNYKESLDEKGQLYLLRIQANVQKMGCLIQDLLELSRIGRIVNSHESVNVREIIQEAIETLQIQLSERGTKLVIQDNLPTIRCDRVRMKQVFENLISNANKFMGDENDKPRIEIGFHEKGDSFEFFVKDNGIGIQKEYHEKVFEIFTRLGDVEVEGTGVGLAIVKKIVETYGGTIWIDSGVSKGMTVYFTLPKSAQNNPKNGTVKLKMKTC